MKGYILMMLTMICQLLQARDIKMNIESYHYIKSTNGETITIVEYQLTNRSDEPYFTWIDFNNHNEKRNKKIHRYFYAPIIGKTNRDEIQNQMRLKFARKPQKRNVTEKSHTSYSQKWLSNVN